VARRQRLVGRAFWTLTAGLGTTGVTAGLLTVLLDALDLLPPSFQVGENGLSGLTTVNSSTFVVALVAGVAGILALERPRARWPCSASTSRCCWSAAR
jgi:hypothetical protein